MARRQPPPDLAGLKPDTRLVSAGRGPERSGRYVNPPVARASTILFNTLAELDAAIAAPDDGLYYGRRGTPGIWALEEALAGLEPGAAGARLYPSGVAAISTALMAVLRTGDDLLITDTAYEPSRLFADQTLAPLGIATRYFDPRTADIAALFRPNTRAVLLESPGSLTFELHDLPAITAACRSAGVTSIIDNTWATPLRLQPLALGCDMAVQALTKYVGGHSDLMMGAVTATPALWARLNRAHYRFGMCVSPDDAALALRGLRTLGLRLARHEASALTIARWLEGHPKVAQVLHPALPSHPDHAIFGRDFSGGTGLFSVVLKAPGRAALAPMLDSLHHFGMGFSWGGYESLALPVELTGCRSLPQAPLPGALVRLSIGLEDPADLMADLEAGLARLP